MTTEGSGPGWLAHLDDIRAALAEQPADKQYHYPIRRGTMRVGLYAPRGRDPQIAHDQDEVYIVHKGTGTFRNGDETKPFGPGDVIFVKAGVDHRFETFSDDFETWVVFWGPPGGEA